MDEEFKDTERDELLAELRAELDELKEELSGLREGDKIRHDEAERKVTTHFRVDFDGDEDDATILDKFRDFVRERYAGAAGATQLPDSTDLIIGRYNDCLKICYLMRVDEFAQWDVPFDSGVATLSPLVRSELVGNNGFSFPKMVFIVWDTCGGGVAESCACGTDSEIGAGEWVVETEGGCGYFPVLTSVQKTSDSEGTTLNITKRNVHVDKCGKILKLGSETSDPILIPCECEEEEDPCPEENSTYTVEWKTWRSVPSYPAWVSCREQFPGMGSTYYYPYKKGRTVFTRGAGGGYSILTGDHQEGLYTQTNCTAGTDPTLVNATPSAQAHLTYDTGTTPNHWQFTVDSGYFYQPDCSPVGSFTNSDGIYYYEATVT